MLKKIIIVIFVITCFQFNSAFSLECAPQLRKIVNKIEQVPEAKQLISKIEQEGQIRIIVNPNPLARQFGACWDIDERVIFVDYSPHCDEGDLIGSIIFELHNASVNNQYKNLFDSAAKGAISKENYVCEMERLEYYNSLNAAKVAQKGILMGIFPLNARLPTYGSFEEHYRMQQVGGHSAVLAQHYDRLRN
jgi:hypothetical protein